MRALAVDFGSKNIGLAVGEVRHGIGSPRDTLHATGTLRTDAKNISSVARREEVNLILVGLPIEKSGLEGKMAKVCRTLGDHLQKLGHEVVFVDESYTSIEAKILLDSSDVSPRRQSSLVHGEAAIVIFERFVREAEKI